MKSTTITSLAFAGALLSSGCSSPRQAQPVYTADQVVRILHEPHGIVAGAQDPVYMSPTLRRFMNEGTDRPARPLY